MATGQGGDRDRYDAPGEGNDEGTDGLDPDDVMPIYLSRLQMQRAYTEHDTDDFSQDDFDEPVEDYDLSSPPLESWYHGRISRQTACERLDLVGEAGGYLVRESVGKTGDYALSYLSQTGMPHHFKINSNCGDYYIGGRRFCSLNDLVGFYANCSCILENESLEVPVVPPKPVPLYMMLRATSPHTTTPGTDELSIETGEVFLLLSFLNDEWGWGRSQKTGQSGLIPIVIMEDVTLEDSNLGKPWFHGYISRDDAVEFLMRNDTPGSYLVRKRAPGSGEDEIHYSMAVRTIDRVQRFLITRYATGYYVFGGRPFNSMEDIIERYLNEVILDGLKLGKPLPKVMQWMPHLSSRKEPDMIQSLSPSSASVRVENPQGPPNRPRSNSSTAPGDLTGTLSLKKGKKSPVGGKWKEFFFVIQCKDRKLLYYEQESRHKAKGLLDLRQCKVYEVHPSLFGANCIVVKLKYLNETTFYYLQVPGDIGNSQWLKALQHCTALPEIQDQKEIQQARSLNLVIKDCKLAKPSSQVFGLIFIDGTCVARTRVMSEVPCVFDEDFFFDDLPLYALDFTCEIHTTRAKRLGSIVGRENSLGRVQVLLSDLPSGQEDDRWHQLMLGNSRTSRGSVRFGALFKDYIILPIEEYADLKTLILSDDLMIIEALAKVCKDHHAELASTLIHIFCTYDRVVPLINACLEKSVKNEENVSTLFRASTLSTMLMDQFMKLTASDYLRAILKEPTKQIVESQESCEISHANLPNLGRGADITANQNRLQDHVAHLLSVIFSSVNQCPPTLKYIYHCLQETVGQKWPKDDSVRIRAVSGFLFLRFVCPALLKPQLFDIVPELPTPTADRTLKLVTKSIQNLANLIEFKAKESFMIYLNPFIKKYTPSMREFINDISKSEECPKSANLISPNPSKDLSTIYHLCYIYNESLQKLSAKQPEVQVLLDVILALRRTEKRVTNKYS